MDGSPYRANVVSVAEPAVYANDLASLPSQYLDVFLDAGLYAPSRVSRTAPLAEQTIDHHLRARSEERTLDQEPSFEHEVPPPPMHWNATPTSSSSPPHPRPESTDLWEEEDSRRIRFALPDETDEHVERLRNSYASRNAGLPLPPPARTSQDSASASIPFQPLDHPPQNASATSLSIPPLRDLIPSFEPWAFPMPPPPPGVLPYTASQLLWDDSTLAVDDHQRSYDFADWMEQWRLRPCEVGCLPAFKFESGPSLWRRPLHKYVRPDDVNEARSDEQGIDWRAFGIERRSALKARRRLHPHDPATHASLGADDEGPHYAFRSFSPHHRARYSHYQLRNMVAAHDRSSIYYAAGSRVMRASSSCPSIKETVMDLAKPPRSATPFKVTCLATSLTDSRNQHDESVLIAGGFNGEYAMLNLNSSVESKPIEGTVSHARDGIVNHINTYSDRQSGCFRATFCSNDHSLRVMDLHRQQFINTFDYESAVNCSALSPDGRLRALVHDGSDSWITNVETGEVLIKLKAHTDFAFACDWSPCGRYVATGAEDRQTIIWDARNWSKPLHALDSVVSCPRSLHFTDDDKLVIAENEDVVSIVDTASFEMRQDVRFFGSMSGVCLVNGGEEIVVANADQTVGGLMSFQRIPRGRGCGGFGARAGNGGRRRGYESSVVEELVI